MNSNSQLLTFIIVGCALLFHGSQLLEVDGGDTLGWMSVVGGMVLAFIGLYFMGDERANHEKYQQRKHYPTHIKSIEVGEDTYQHMVTDTEQDHIEQLLREEKVIEALGYYRRVTGHSLLEAKEYIDKTLKDMDRRARTK